MKKVYSLSWGHPTPQATPKVCPFEMKTHYIRRSCLEEASKISTYFGCWFQHQLQWKILKGHFRVREEEVLHHIDLHSFPVNILLSWYRMLHVSIFQDRRPCSRDNLRWREFSTACGDAAEGCTEKATASAQHETWLWEVHIWCLDC